ncbi:hypothetical protein EU537_09950 [Candidatus Thorarchaeota archaeon]|nr:MAG: hypothetical protein EU537_09950 [Candidatus Thorarchaeota archaeon]
MQFFDPFEFISTFGILFVIIPILIIVISVFVCIRIIQGFSQLQKGFTVTPPSFVIPERYQKGGLSDSSKVRTVRLPERCPSCGASLTHEDIDWTGPLEARCNYCGGTVHAKFEDI